MSENILILALGSIDAVFRSHSLLLLLCHATPVCYGEVLQYSSLGAFVCDFFFPLWKLLVSFLFLVHIVLKFRSEKLLYIHFFPHLLC